MTYTWLLFDADGTLFDYDQAEAYAFRAALTGLGQPFEPHYLTEYRRINHALWLELEQGQIDQATLRVRRFEQLTAALNLKADPRHFSDLYIANLARGAFLMADAEQTIKTLVSKCRLAIITNGLADVQRARFSRSTIYPYIKEIIISEEVGVAKPDPAIFEIALARMGGPARREVLMIGDSLSSDIQGGLNYDLDTCWFNPSGQPNGQVKYTFQIQRLAQLPELLGIPLLQE
jgi:2-haloacid dehalogenase